MKNKFFNILKILKMIFKNLKKKIINHNKIFKYCKINWKKLSLKIKN